MSFYFEPQKINDVILIKPNIIKDNRGYFFECYKKSEFVKNGINQEFVQDNSSFSKNRVLRGIHYQAKPYLQAKLVTCIKGKIIDIAVDLRPNSPSFCQYVKAELSEENNSALYIPEGFGHSFVVLSEEAQIHYKVSQEFIPEADRGIIWSDKNINIDWGIDFEPILSEKDRNLPNLKNIDFEELF